MKSSDKTREHDRAEDRDGPQLARMLFWVGFGVGVAALGLVVAYTTIRLASTGRDEDPTSQRIQQLIDEANSLLKALDEQRHSA
jgi:hypothetical protein